jgi:hypothetical protein
VAKVHNLESNLDSITVATANLSGSAFKSCNSATNKIISNNVSIHNHVSAETGTIIVFHHQSSGCNHCSANCHFTNSGFAHALSILLIATIIGTFASLA